MILLDTDIVTLLHSPPSQPREALVAWLESAADSGEEIVVSIISFEEQVRGWLALINRHRDPVKQVNGYERLHRLIERYQELQLVDFDETAANRFVALRAAHRRSNTMDLKIAAIAMSHDAMLVSRNARDFTGIGELRFKPFAG